MNRPAVSTSSGFIFFLVLFTLKLTHVINWSWWWVTAPLWVPIAIAFVIALVIELSIPRRRRR